MKDITRFVKLAALSLPVFYVFWIIFVGTFSLHELLIGVIGAGLASTGLLVVEFCYPARFSPRLGELLALWRIPGYLVTGTWEVIAVAAKDQLGIKRAQSLFRIVRFDAGKKDDSHATARRVLAASYTTIAPNFIVLGVNTNNRELLFHQIERSPVPAMTKDLGAQG